MSLGDLRLNIYLLLNFTIFLKKQFEAGIDEIKIRDYKISISRMEKTIYDYFGYCGKLGLSIANKGFLEIL